MGYILIFGSGEIGNLGTFHFFAFVDIPYLPVPLSRSVAVRADNHADILSATRAVMRTVSLACRTAHDKWALRYDQHKDAINAAATKATKEIRHPSVRATIRQQMATNINMPARVSRRRYPA